MGKEVEILKSAFLKCVRAAEYHLGVRDVGMAEIMADVCRELVEKHPAAPELADHLDFRRTLRRFRALNVGRAPLDQRPVVEHLLAVELGLARNAVLWPLGPVDAA